MRVERKTHVPVSRAHEGSHTSGRRIFGPLLLTFVYFKNYNRMTDATHKLLFNSAVRPAGHRARLCRLDLAYRAGWQM